MTGPARVVSMLASGTELVCALGAGDRLVGRSHECDHPAWVKKLPAVSRPTFDISGSSREIDERVRARLRAGLPLYEVDEDVLMSLEPDLIITQSHCEVCAVTPADVAHAIPAHLVRKQIAILETGSLAAILAGFLEVARVLDLANEGERLLSGLRARLAAVADKARTLAPVSVVCLEWIAPPFAMGNWGPELVELAGGVNVLGTAGVHSSAVSWEAVQDADPDVLVVAPCGFGLERASAEMHVLEASPGWERLRAVRTRRVFVSDGNLYFNRSGPTMFETPEILAQMLHPDEFEPMDEGRAWRRWP